MLEHIYEHFYSQYRRLRRLLLDTNHKKIISYIYIQRSNDEKQLLLRGGIFFPQAAVFSGGANSGTVVIQEGSASGGL